VYNKEYCSGFSDSNSWAYDLTTQMEIIARTSVHSETEILQITENKIFYKSGKSGIIVNKLCAKHNVHFKYLNDEIVLLKIQCDFHSKFLQQ